jgi:chromosomal replication initiation ATPase DnaA
MNNEVAFAKILDGYSAKKLPRYRNVRDDILHFAIQHNFNTQFSIYTREPKGDIDTYILWQKKHEVDVVKTERNHQEVNVNIVKEKVKERIVIASDVRSIEDLLHIIKHNTHDPSKEYNIDLKALHSIETELSQLNGMIGLTSVKTSILRQLMYFMQGFADDPKDGDYKHTVLTGPPGTGKTEIAKILGNMYSKIGILKKNTFKKVTRTDLVAGYLGQTAIKTRKVLDESMGGVLFIDEAYSLQNDDTYAKECVDTLCEGLSDHKNELMVIIAGYQAELDNTFFRINSGIRSRFIWRFDIEPYGSKELHLIFLHLATSRNWIVDDHIKQKWFDTNRQFFKDNGRSMEQLFSYSKISHAQRIYGKDVSLRKTLTCEDLQDGLSLYKEFGNAQKNDNISMGLYI